MKRSIALPLLIALLSVGGYACSKREDAVKPTATATAQPSPPPPTASPPDDIIPIPGQGRTERGGCPAGFSEDDPAAGCSRYRDAGRLGAPRWDFRVIAAGTALLVVGGRDERGPLSTVDVYDITEAQWKESGKLATPRYRHAAVALNDGRVLVMGGSGPTGILGSTEIYDPKARVWKAGAPLAAPRSDAAAALLPDGRVLIAGGRDARRECLRTAEIYDPATDRFQAAGPLGAAQRSATAVVVPGGKVVVVGGSCGDAVSGVEVFDPGSGAWSPGAAPATPRSAAGVAALADGRILLVGGSAPKVGALASAEIWSAERGWVAAGEMRTARQSPVMTVRSDGRVLVTGGSVDKRSPTGSVEVYDPERGRWTEMKPLPFPVIGHGAALLGDGRALIFGGMTHTEEGEKSVGEALFYEWVER